MHKKTGNEVLDEQYRMSLKYSVLDGAFFALMLGLGEYYFGAYAILLSASSLQLGLFGSLPFFLGYTFQLLAPKFVSFFGSRKKMMLLFAIIRTILWIPLMLAFSYGSNKVWIFIALISAYFITNFVQQAPWTSWMGDLVNETQRPIYFGKRSSITTALSLLGIVFGGFFLQFIRESPNYSPETGFIALFVLALFSSIISLIFISLKTDVPYNERKEDQFNLKEFIKELPNNSFGRFTIFNTTFFFGVFIAAPFFVPLQLSTLKFTYIEYMFGLVAFFISKSIFFKIWGMITTKYGDSKPLFISIITLSIIPLFYGIFVKFPWQVYIIEIFSGMGWAGYELLSFNYIYDTVSPAKRPRSMSYQNFFKGISMLIGGFVGSILMMTGSYLLVFGISTIIRTVAILYLRLNKDTLKDLEPISYKNLIFELFSSIPREGRDVFIVGIKTAKTRLSLMTDQSAKFSEEGNIIKQKK